MNTATISEWRHSLNRDLDHRRHAVETVKSEKADLAACEQALADAVAGQALLQEAAKAVQQRAHRHIARIVSRCLTAVFDKRYELRIEFESKRGKTEAKFIYLCNGRKSDPSVDSGGVREVASLALRLAALTFTMPPARKLLVLDEPFLGVDAVNMPKMALLLETLTEELGMQIIVVTHNQSLQVGKVYAL